MFGTPNAIFISYSHRNSIFTDRLEADLEACNFYTWVDRRKFEGSQPWKNMLRESIDLCDVLLVILSPASVTSNYVQMEYRYALDTGKPIIPLEYQSCQIPIDLKDIERVDFKTDYEQGLRNLLVAVNSVETEGQLLRLGHIDYLRKHAQLAQKACQWRKAGGFWHALLGWDPQSSEAILSLPQCLREQSKEASSSGQWELAISAWEDLLQLKPGDAQATRQLSLAHQNQSYVQYYKDALQFIEENEPSPARMQLCRLWQYAPYYGDPEGLALKVEITKPPRSPATLDKEEEERIAVEEKAELARKQKAEAERLAKERERLIREQKERAERQEAERHRREREQKEKAEREKAEQERQERVKRERAAQKEAERQQREWERVQQEKEQQERIELEARERILRRLPDWFINHELETTPLPVWCGLFFLLSGLGMAIDIVTQSMPSTFGAIAITTLLTYILGHHRTIHRWPERSQLRVEQNMGQPFFSAQSEDEISTSIAIYVIATLAIIVICSLMALFFVNYVSTLSYNARQTGHFLWITRSWWLERQIKAGLIIGATLSLIIALWFALRQKFGSALGNALVWSVGIGFSGWLICSLLGLIFNWGWGFGSRWEFGLLGFAVGVIGGVGLGSSFAVWKKGKPIFLGLF